MAIPDYEKCMLPFLRAISDGKEHTFQEVIEAVSNEFSLTVEERRELLPSGTQFIIMNRVGWARTYLKKAGLIVSPKRGVFYISDEGKKVVREEKGYITVDYLKRYDSFNEFQKRITTVENPQIVNTHINESNGTRTPEEAIEYGYQKILSSLSEELVGIIKSCTPAFFEKLVIDLLIQMGYGGSLKEAGQIVGKVGDGGIDGIIKEDKLGLDVIYIQAKKWEASVGRPEIQKFAGALLGQKAKKGIFITTSWYTQEAIEYVKNIDSKIVLIDGIKLTELMIENNLGVSISKKYEIKRIDGDYFVET